MTVAAVAYWYQMMTAGTYQRAELVVVAESVFVWHQPAFALLRPQLTLLGLLVLSRVCSPRRPASAAR